MNDNNLKNIMTEAELFDSWRNKPRFVSSKNVVINHAENRFVPDGIVNKKEWDKIEKNKILYILKEAHSAKIDSDMAKWLGAIKPSDYAIWKRVVQWTYGITHTTIDSTPDFLEGAIDYSENNYWLNKIAMLNIKKSDGRTPSIKKELLAYAEYDKKEIIRQIEIINPNIIVCGSTAWLLDKIFEGSIKNENSNNWYYTPVLLGEKRIVLACYHPAYFTIKAEQSFNDVTKYYQLALKELQGK